MARKLFEPYGYDGRNWAMSFAERFALLGVLQQARPKQAIEVGTLEGGSLSLISHFSREIISIDPNPEVAKNLGPKHPNVRFLTESSRTALPRVLQAANRTDDEINFILIDGDHSEEGVHADISAALTYRPRGPLWLMMHDSFNPDCRRAMKRIDWEAQRYVHWVDFDFIPGFLNSVPGWEDQMWCGFAVAYLEPVERTGPLSIDELLGRQFEKVLPISTHAQS